MSSRVRVSSPIRVMIVDVFQYYLCLDTRCNIQGPGRSATVESRMQLNHGSSRTYHQRSSKRSTKLILSFLPH